MLKFDNYPYSENEIEERIKNIFTAELDDHFKKDAFTDILSCIDLTTLEGADTNKKIISLCQKARTIEQLNPGLPNVAAVCFYPPFVKLAKKELDGTGIRVASVAGAFPSGQSPIDVKLQEVKFAVNEGADEIDMVISRGKLLEGENQQVFDEIAAIKDVCGDVHLKVILETGELQTIENIRKAAELAINAGGDFIKTSTGKIQPAATPEAFLVMADTVKEFFSKTGKMIGLKPAGGISAPEEALKYYRIVASAVGKEWLNKDYFRIGASRLTNRVIERLT